MSDLRRDVVRSVLQHNKDISCAKNPAAPVDLDLAAYSPALLIRFLFHTVGQYPARAAIRSDRKEDRVCKMEEHLQQFSDLRDELAQAKILRVTDKRSGVTTTAYDFVFADRAEEMVSSVLWTGQVFWLDEYRLSDVPQLPMGLDFDQIDHLRPDRAMPLIHQNYVL